MGYVEAALVLVLSTASGDIIDSKVVRTFVKDRHCTQFYYDPAYTNPFRQHALDYWLENREYAKPGYLISFRCKRVGPYYTA
jgi:hypothetical protein